MEKTKENRFYIGEPAPGLYSPNLEQRAKTFLKEVVSKAPALKHAPMVDFIYYRMEKESKRVGPKTEYGQALINLADSIWQDYVKRPNIKVNCPRVEPVKELYSG